MFNNDFFKGLSILILFMIIGKEHFCVEPILKLLTVIFLSSINMSSVKEAYEAWKLTCTVPDHPKRCPECQHKVKLYHTPKNRAAFMCSNIGKVNNNILIIIHLLM